MPGHPPAPEIEGGAGLAHVVLEVQQHIAQPPPDDSTREAQQSGLQHLRAGEAVAFAHVQLRLQRRTVRLELPLIIRRAAPRAQHDVVHAVREHVLVLKLRLPLVERLREFIRGPTGIIERVAVVHPPDLLRIILKLERQHPQAHRHAAHAATIIAHGHAALVDARLCVLGHLQR